MTKKQKIDYINQINDRFINARNHGHNGNNWWYPKENRIAYNVKVYGGISTENIRKKMTERQNNFYSDDAIYELLNDWQCQIANDLSEEIEMLPGVQNTSYAGRSSGWLEVDYINDIDPSCDAAMDIDANYEFAKELEKNEVTVSKLIKK